jgi:predicted component of type VI protein secretion system
MAVNETVELDETAAADTLKPGSKTELLQNALSKMAGMSSEDLSHFLNDSLAQVGNSSAGVPEGAAAKNKASIAMKESIKEDIDSMFGEDLSEDLKDRATMIFEAAVSAQVEIGLASLAEEFQEALDEELENQAAELVEKVDRYLSYVTEQWMEKNEVAINGALRLEIAEDFIGGLKTLFEDHYIDVPDDKYDVVDELTQTVEDLEARLNESTALALELIAEREDRISSDIVLEVAEGLSATQVEKLKTLSEGVSFDTEDDFRNKVQTLRESLIEKKPIAGKTGLIVEESAGKTVDELDEEDKKVISPQMRRYADAISRTVAH